MNKRISPVFQTGFVPLQGVAAVILSYMFLGQVPTTAEYLGGSIVIVGLVGLLIGQYNAAAVTAAHDAAAAKELQDSSALNDERAEGRVELGKT